MTEGVAIDRAWADYFEIADHLRPMSSLPEDGSLDAAYLIDQNMGRHWADYWERKGGWWCPDKFDEYDAIGWLPA